eukprot:844174-Prymnesium_polylepis.1
MSGRTATWRQPFHSTFTFTVNDQVCRLTSNKDSSMRTRTGYNSLTRDKAPFCRPDRHASGQALRTQTSGRRRNTATKAHRPRDERHTFWVISRSHFGFRSRGLDAWQNSLVSVFSMRFWNFPREIVVVRGSTGKAALARRAAMLVAATCADRGSAQAPAPIFS